MDELNTTFEFYNKYSLYDLRKLGKGLGISNPSAMTKSKLIETIIMCKNGIYTPKSDSRRGRPSKKSLLWIAIIT